MTDDTTVCYVVTYGEGRCCEDIHGVFMDEQRAEIAAEELQRIYGDPGEWATVEEHELVTEREWEVKDE